MDTYDIIQVEDSDLIRRGIERSAERAGLSYFGVPCLKDLSDALPNSNARVFLVDGKFPKVVDEQILPLAFEAISSIRSHYPDASIYLFSGEMDGEEIAQKNRVKYANKGDHSASSLVELLKGELGGE